MTRAGAGSGAEDESGEGSSDDDVVNVEFEFIDPREIHYKSVRQLLEHYLPGEEESFNVSGMADAIVSQIAAGTMVAVNGDPLDVYAFATVLPVALYKVRTGVGWLRVGAVPLHRAVSEFSACALGGRLHGFGLTARLLPPHPQDTDWMQSIRKHVLGAAREAVARKALSSGGLARLTALFEDPAASGLGLLVNERVVNMPPELAPAIHESLGRDCEWARAHAEPEGARAAFGGLRTLLLLSPCFSERASGADIAHRVGAVSGAGAAAAGAASAPRSRAEAPLRKQRQAGSAAKGPAAEPPALEGWLTHYLHFEEELYVAQAPSGASFAYPVKDFEKGSSSGGAVSSSAGAVSSSGSGGAVSSSSSSSSSSAAAPADFTLAPAPRASTLNKPASRRVAAFPMEALPVCVEAMKHLLVMAQQE